MRRKESFSLTSANSALVAGWAVDIVKANYIGQDSLGFSAMLRVLSLIETTITICTVHYSGIRSVDYGFLEPWQNLYDEFLEENPADHIKLKKRALIASSS